MPDVALVTGADGFIGSHLTELLVAQGYEVKALTQYNSFNHWGWLEDTNCLEWIEVIPGDIRDPHLCNRITKGVDLVFHLAALIAIPYSYRAPDSYVDTNIKGTLNICQAALENEVGRIVHTSTSEVYGTAKQVPINEDHPLQAQSPYSATKIGADAIAMSFCNAFDLPVTIARPFNTFGPRQSARAVIPTIITQIASGMRRISLGDITPTRDFSYVEDTCRDIVALAECNAAIGETVNIGSGKEVSVGDILGLIKELMNSDAESVLERERVRPAKSEVYRLCCDNSKLQNLIGVHPAVGLREGLNRTINWLQIPKNLDRYKAKTYNQ